MARAFFFGCGIWIAVRDSRKVPKCRNVSLIRTAAATAVSIGAVVILALLMVPVFFVSVQRVLAGDREKAPEKAAAAAPVQPTH